MNDKMKSKFFELVSVRDLHAMQFACECEHGIGSELAYKLEKFLEEVKQEEPKDCITCEGSGMEPHSHDACPDCGGTGEE
jgi:DnaJ-class molecular chaperone